ncbi:hypothetical protein WAE58_04660 [Pedobacter panaciterrae]|uniref:Secreted protein n=1 Tax=Pedobacter panaciterrae TaxID=363849 RepID=A0ABU8NHH2_9SPHI
MENTNKRNFLTAGVLVGRAVMAAPMTALNSNSLRFLPVELSNLPRASLKSQSPATASKQ